MTKAYMTEAYGPIPKQGDPREEKWMERFGLLVGFCEHLLDKDL